MFEAGFDLIRNSVGAHKEMAHYAKVVVITILDITAALFTGLEFKQALLTLLQQRAEVLDERVWTVGAGLQKHPCMHNPGAQPRKRE